MYTPNQISDWILARFNFDAGDTISPLKLQKLLYYCQAWHYTIFGEPLFNEPIQAWSHGPVVPSQYKRFASIPRNATIDISLFSLEDVAFSIETQELLIEVMNIYGEHTAFYLEQLTHKERPWKETRGSLPDYEKCDKEITLDLMREYYSQVNQ